MKKDATNIQIYKYTLWNILYKIHCEIKTSYTLILDVWVPLNIGLVFNFLFIIIFFSQIFIAYFNIY